MESVPNNAMQRECLGLGLTISIIIFYMHILIFIK